MRPKHLPILISAFLLYVWAVFYFFPLPTLEELASDQKQAAVSQNIPTKEFDELVEKIKNDIGQPDIEVMVLVGPYFQYRGLIAAINLYYAPRYYIMIDGKFLNELTPEEKVAVIAHEMGHIVVGPGYGFSRKQRTATEVLADRFASRYVHPKHVQSLLDKANEDYLIRTDNLTILGQAQGQ